MSIRPQSFDALVRAIAQFPGIGQRSASRIALWLLSKPESVSDEIGMNIVEMRKKIKKCKICRQLTESEICDICSDETRNRRVICVVEEALDVWKFESSREYRGLYHVLGGAISPVDGIGHDELAIDLLIERIKKAEPKIEEIILATDPDTEGNATAYYIAELLSEFSLRKTRLAHGIPVGAEVAYSDEATLAAAIGNRKPF